MEREPFPTCVGMNRLTLKSIYPSTSVPYMWGDEPDRTHGMAYIGTFAVPYMCGNEPEPLHTRNHFARLCRMQRPARAEPDLWRVAQHRDRLAEKKP